MFCKNCGHQLTDESKFCQNCGCKIDTPAPQQTPEEPICVENVEEVVTEVATSYDDPATIHTEPITDPKKEKLDKIFNYVFRGGLIAATVGAFIFFAIVVVSLIGWGEVYLFDGYDFTIALAWVSLVLMVLGIIATAPLFVINLKQKSIKLLEAKRAVSLIAALLVVCVGFSIWGFVDASENSDDDYYGGSDTYVSLWTAYYENACDSPYASYGGSYLKIDTNPYDYDSDSSSSTTYSSIALAKIIGINSTLGFPSYVYQEMINTRALDGVQTYTGSRFSATWRYHPDSGLEVMYTEN